MGRNISSKKHCKMGQPVRFIQHGPQILPPQPRMSTVTLMWNETSTAARHTFMKRWINVHTKKNQVRYIVSAEKRNQSRKGTNLLEPFWTFPHCFFFSFSLHPPPFSPYPYYIPLQVQSSPLFSPFFFLAASLFELMSGGISVAGPHPSQITAWMVPCSVQSSELQFCHNEH